jgi:hypothetical protein
MTEIRSVTTNTNQRTRCILSTADHGLPDYLIRSVRHNQYWFLKQSLPIILIPKTALAHYLSQTSASHFPTLYYAPASVEAAVLHPSPPHHPLHGCRASRIPTISRPSRARHNIQGGAIASLPRHRPPSRQSPQGSLCSDTLHTQWRYNQAT